MSCHYMIDMEEAAGEMYRCQWYVDLWDEFSQKKRDKKEESVQMDIEDDTSSITSMTSV